MFQKENNKQQRLPWKVSSGLVSLGTDEFHSRKNHHIVSLDHRVIATVAGMVKWKPLKLHPTPHPKVTNTIISQTVMEGA